MSVGESGHGDRPHASDGAAVLARGLTGDLRCLGCSYNLNGLSIRGTCPECGLAVKATILAVVDPQAEELAPLRWPNVVAWGLVVWAAAGVLATLGAWLLRLDEAGEMVLNRSMLPGWWPGVLVALVAFAAAGLIPAIRPLGTIRPVMALRAALGVGLFFGTAWIMWLIVGVHDAAEPTPYLRATDPSRDRLVLRIAMAASLAAALLCVRPNLRLLAARSVVVREGRVNRQSILAVIGAVLVGAAGDVVMLVLHGQTGTVGDLARVVHVSLAALGAVLLTSGVFNLLRDTLRLRPVLAATGLGITDVLADEEAQNARSRANGPAQA